MFLWKFFSDFSDQSEDISDYYESESEDDIYEENDIPSSNCGHLNAESNSNGMCFSVCLSQQQILISHVTSILFDSIDMNIRIQWNLVTIFHHQMKMLLKKHLLSLFASCPICGGTAEAPSTKVIGTMLKINQRCANERSCQFSRMCLSQPFVKGQMPCGNLLLSASILISG